MQVVRCFEDPDVTHVTGKVDPLSDIETIETELMLADIQTLENAMTKAVKKAKSQDKDAKRQVETIKRCSAYLEEEEKPLRQLNLNPLELKDVKSFGLLTSKPILFVANVDETDLEGKGELVGKVRAQAEKVGASVVPICAKLESEIAELDEDDRQETLESLGLKESALATLARAAYKTLGLQSYFTAGDKEVRAWTVPIGATAPQAAGVIHTDFERGFIRVEVYSLDDLKEHESEKNLRAAGRLRLEGKEYVMADGDICHFLFNV